MKQFSPISEDSKQTELFPQRKPVLVKIPPQVVELISRVSDAATVLQQAVKKYEKNNEGA